MHGGEGVGEFGAEPYALTLRVDEAIKGHVRRRVHFFIFHYGAAFGRQRGGRYEVVQRDARRHSIKLGVASEVDDRIRVGAYFRFPSGVGRCVTTFARLSNATAICTFFFFFWDFSLCFFLVMICSLGR